MQLSTITATPAFLNLEEEAKNAFMQRTLNLLGSSDFPDVDFVVGDPKATAISFEDGDRTARVPFSGGRSVYAKVDGGDHTPAEWAAQGHPEYPILTFLLPSEY